MNSKPKKIQLIFVIYWILLAYIIAALIFWFTALMQQNQQMTTFKLQRLKSEEVNYPEQYLRIEDEKRRKTAQYIGEGSIFLLLILAGAIFIFRAVRRQLRQSHEQQNFMIAITHELKTPIAVTKLNLETLQRRKLDETQQQRLIHNTVQEANRLNTLCNNMLLSSQIEAGGYRGVDEEASWTNIVTECCQDFTTRYPDRQLQQQIAEDVFVIGDQLLLQIVVNNLVENALKYSPKDSTVTVVLEKKSNIAVLKVIDSGVGIAREERKKVFQKFYRIGNEATKRAKGTGLGLYLTKKIVTTHKGTINISDNPGGGSIVTVSLKAEA
ncbi:sensor histidine kinase KdpD [Ferruginibacter sp. HRS2-29]|uniref:sensor histidine kinase n=1 Tax=Ferruginibacter sp. HRS2-29 TaxID=2487334 RepID=UPI0020CF5B8B|nr:HAMP domain-containing sensor histidine kinase [Ferruginibacter sp. HRS2-29]MCP9750471.1 sensor histidine kinase [Ferruginibacter sp. HRS2-29]